MATTLSDADLAAIKQRLAQGDYFEKQKEDLTNLLDAHATLTEQAKSLSLNLAAEQTAHAAYKVHVQTQAATFLKTL